MVSEPVILLKKLYASCRRDEQRQFCSALLGKLSAKNGVIVAHALVELSDTASLRYWELINEASIRLWSGIADKLAIEHWTFSDKAIEDVAAGRHRLEIHSGAAVQRNAGQANEQFRLGRSMHAVVSDLREIIDRVQYLRVAAQLKNFGNPAIDADRQILLSRLEGLGFGSRLTQALHEVEKREAGAATELDFKAAMDLLRSFLEVFVREAAVRVAAKSAVTLPHGETLRPFAPWKDYLRNSELITRQEEELLQKLYGYLSTESVHALGAGPEQLRVSRVTVIEWCMLIAGRVQKYLS
jgi:hypothetical protein